MSISTIYLASGSTPENDTRIVGNIRLLKQKWVAFTWVNMFFFLKNKMVQVGNI